MRQTIPTSFQATCRAQFFTRLEHGETSPKQTILTRFRISLYFFSETNILRFSSNFKIYFFPPLKTHKTLTWTNCSSASRTIDVTSAERDPSTCALTSASGRSLQYNDRKKRTKKKQKWKFLETYVTLHIVNINFDDCLFSLGRVIFQIGAGSPTTDTSPPEIWWITTNNNMKENSNAPSKNEIWATKGRKTATESWLTVTLTTGYSCTFYF